MFVFALFFWNESEEEGGVFYYDFYHDEVFARRVAWHWHFEGYWTFLVELDFSWAIAPAARRAA